jgi:hypothetical protein
VLTIDVNVTASLPFSQAPAWPNPPIPSRRRCIDAVLAGRRQDALTLAGAPSEHYVARPELEFELAGLTWLLGQPPPHGMDPAPHVVVVSHRLPSNAIARRIGLVRPGPFSLIRDWPCSGLARVVFDRLGSGLAGGTVLDDNYWLPSVLDQSDLAHLHQGRH